MIIRFFKAIWEFIQELIQKGVDAVSDYDAAMHIVNSPEEKDVLVWGAPLRYKTNDIEVVYRNSTKRYYLNLDTSWWFDTKKEEIEYLEELQQEFLKFLKQRPDAGETTKKFDYIFWMSNPGELFTAESIEELYVSYALFVAGYKALFEENKDNTHPEERIQYL
jgi:hypothetical protein